MEQERGKMEQEKIRRRAGYLMEDFRLFYNKDEGMGAVGFHYHDFHKIFLFLGGNAGYAVEGRQYDLLPGDIILVPAGEIHQPILYDTSVYERVILYLSSSFFAACSAPDADLESCFRLCQETGIHRIRIKKETGKAPERRRHTSGQLTKDDQLLNLLIRQLVFSSSDQQFASTLYRRVKIQELLILINRMLRDQMTLQPEQGIVNQTVTKLIHYIHTHLTQEELSIDRLAQELALDRYYLMHVFKKETGCTIGQYITKKRLFMAKRLLSSGISVTQACYQCGFRNYSAFYYAYRKAYGRIDQIPNQPSFDGEGIE